MNNPPVSLIKRDSKTGRYLAAKKSDQKTCTICLKIKSIKEFYPVKNRPLGLTPQCIECDKKRIAKNHREWRKKDPEAARKYDREYRRKRPDVLRNKFLKKAYKIDLNQFKEMVRAQDSKCKICSTQTKLDVDHCHTANKVRALLCGCCNRGLGQFKDNIKNLELAIQYLKFHQ